MNSRLIVKGLVELVVRNQVNMRLTRIYLSRTVFNRELAINQRQRAKKSQEVWKGKCFVCSGCIKCSCSIKTDRLKFTNMCNWSTCNKRYHMSIFTAYNRLALVRFCILILLKAELWWVMFWYLLLYFSKIIVVEKCLKMYQIVYVYIHVSHGNSTDFVDKGLYLYVLCTNIHLQWGL